MASNSGMGRYAPRASGVRDPRDSSKRNGIFHNPPRYQYLGGAPGPFTQAGTRKIKTEAQANAAGPISDRGRGR